MMSNKSYWFDYVGDLDDKKNTSGYIFMMSSGVVSWSSNKQQVVTLFTTEAEFIAATTCACQAIWLKRILEILYKFQQGPIQLYCDHSSTIKPSNTVVHGRKANT